MIAADIIRNAAAAGITLAARGDQLAVMPATLLSPDLRALLIAHKVELLDWLRRPANDTRPRIRAWTIVLVDGVKVTAVNTTGADDNEMLVIAQDQFGAARVVSVEVPA